jgi:mercuric ion transport protein
MNTTTKTSRRSAVLSYFSLFTSLGTLLCCALPSVLVLFGLGASVASTLSFLPWLVSLSRHKAWTFSMSGGLIAWGFLNTYYIGARFRTQDCSPIDPAACAVASRLSKVLLWISAGIYLVGFFVAYGLGSILTRMDGGSP